MQKSDFYDAIYDNKHELVKENFDFLDSDGKAKVFYFACGEG